MPHYNNAPIVEAVIELRSQLPKEITISDLQRMCGRLEADFPKKKDVIQGHFQLQFGAAATPSAAQQPLGYQLDSEDGKHIVQIRLDTFAFSRLAPYDHWETFRAQAQTLWAMYRDLFRPQIGRVGVRYINRVDVPTTGGPADSVDLDDYFLTAPRIASALPQGMTSFFMRIQIPMEQGVNAIIIETPAAPPRDGFVSTILDIDLSFQRDILSEEEAWTRLERLRHDKNRVFEACITDKVRELIK